MRLIDRVTSCTARVYVERKGQAWNLPGAGSFAGRLDECPSRYILFDDARDASLELAERWPDLLSPLNSRLRIPVEKMWVEWTQLADLESKPRQVGVLIDAPEDGRSGTIRSFWSQGETVECGQVAIEFDLDRPFDFHAKVGPRRFPVRAVPDDYAALKPHLAVVIDLSWQRYFRSTALGPDGLAEAADLCSRTLWADAIQAFAFVYLLSSKMPFQERQIRRERINAARARAGKPSLRDHVELRLGAPIAMAGGGHSGSRRYPRLHLVRGHLVRRRDRVFWRAAHLRGGGQAGDLEPRTTVVKMSKWSPLSDEVLAAVAL